MDQATGISVNIPRAVAAELLLERLEQIGIPKRALFQQSTHRTPPAIGESFEGGIYAGITIHDNTPLALVLLPGESTSIIWQDAIKWAEKAGGELPSRFDALTLFTNLKSEFKEEWYWTSAQHASNESYAWMQGFYYGHQGYHRKDYAYRARAVRRVAI